MLTITRGLSAAFLLIGGLHVLLTIYVIRENIRLRYELQCAGEQRKRLRNAARKQADEADAAIAVVQAELAAMTADRDKYRKIAYGIDAERIRLVKEKAAAAR